MKFSRMPWRGALAAAALVLTGAAPAPRPAAGPAMIVYKSASCGCCKHWVTYMQRKGFAVTARDMDDMDEVKASYGVPAKVQSCHTAIVNGYVVEGHVPAEVVEQLLREKPKVTGIAVPGMVGGSPGMEIPGQAPEHYDIVTFDKAGTTKVYAKR